MSSAQDRARELLAGRPLTQLLDDLKEACRLRDEARDRPDEWQVRVVAVGWVMDEIDRRDPELLDRLITQGAL